MSWPSAFLPEYVILVNPVFNFSTRGSDSSFISDLKSLSAVLIFSSTSSSGFFTVSFLAAPVVALEAASEAASEAFFAALEFRVMKYTARVPAATTPAPISVFAVVESPCFLYPQVFCFQLCYQQLVFA